MLPDEKDAARKLKFQASQFVLIKDVLYNRGLSRSYLRCLSHEETEVPGITICADKRCSIQKRILATILKVPKPRGSRLRNERSSRGYLLKPLGGTVIRHKLIRVGYYWPTMLNDAQAYLKAYKKCQRFSNLIKQPSEELTPMAVPWPFAQ